MCGFNPVCGVQQLVAPVWHWIVLGFWIAVAAVALIVLLTVLDRLNRIFGKPGVWAALASLALAAAFVLGRRSIPRQPIKGAPRPRALTREEIKALQQALAGRALYDGPIDGIFGARSEAALIAFQRRRGEPPTGRPTPAQLQTLGVW